jgi:hypothetical protein
MRLLSCVILLALNAAGLAENPPGFLPNTSCSTLKTLLIRLR